MTSNNMPDRVSNRPFRNIVVLGAGTMGSQIAGHCANAGMQVALLDIAPKDGPQAGAVPSA